MGVLLWRGLCNVSFVELFVDFLVATGTMPAVPFKKGWTTEDANVETKLVHRNLHQHALSFTTR